MHNYRQVGGKLAAYMRANDPSTQQIQALLSDLLAGDDLLLPMRDAVSRPGFSALMALAGSGAGTVERQALLQELGRFYLPIVIEGVGTVLAGMLDLASSGSASAGSSPGRDEDKFDPWQDASYKSRVPWDTKGWVTIQDLAVYLGVETDNIIRFLHGRGILATASQTIDPEAVLAVLEELDRPRAEKKQEECAEDLVKLMGDLRSGTARRESHESKRLSSAICDDTIWNPQRDPELDKRFLEAWNLRWFNKRYRPRLEKD